MIFYFWPKFCVKKYLSYIPPSLLCRGFYSAFVFVTIGAFLYYVVKLWKLIYFICVTILRSRELYKLVKCALWMFLIVVTYLYIFPVITKVFNAGISFFYNIMVLFLYLLPSVGVFIIIFVCSYLIYGLVKNNIK